MSSTAKRILQKTSALLPPRIKRLLYRTGVEIGGDESFPSVSSSLKYIRDRGYRPQHIVDVGAYHGEWTSLVREIFPQAAVLMVEPQEQKRAQLERVCAELGPNVTFQNALLGADDGHPVEFVVMETGSSVLEEQSDYPRTKALVHTTSLDTLIDGMPGWDRMDFLKLDVQGYELEVLRGATSYLPRCEFVLMEVSIVPVNLGAPTVEEVFVFMTELGFRMLDICDQHRINKVLVQVDLLFINVRSAHAPALFHDYAPWCDRYGLSQDEVLPDTTWAAPNATSYPMG